MGINLGALISPIICSYVGEKISWRLGFAVAGAGMLLGVVQYILQSGYLGEAGLHPATTGDPEKDRHPETQRDRCGKRGRRPFRVGGNPLRRGGDLDGRDHDLERLGWSLLLITVLVFSWLIGSSTWTTEERKRSAAVLVLFIASALFWASFEQAGSSLNLFAERQTNRYIMGWEFPAGWFQFVQPIFVVVLAPVFAWLWMAMGRRHAEPSSPGKFTWDCCSRDWRSRSWCLPRA